MTKGTPSRLSEEGEGESLDLEFWQAYRERLDAPYQYTQLYGFGDTIDHLLNDDVNELLPTDKTTPT